MSVTAAEGFVAAGIHAGIKRRRHDMALLATADRKPVTAAAVFTQNKFAAPPVELDALPVVFVEPLVPPDALPDAVPWVPPDVPD